MYIKNREPFRPNKIKNSYFEFFVELRHYLIQYQKRESSNALHAFLRQRHSGKFEDKLVRGSVSSLIYFKKVSII